MVAYLLAVVAAAANATSNVIQRAADREEPPDLSMRPRLILDLIRRPLWLAGLGTIIASFILMASALSMGRLAAIQPIVVLELPLTLLGAAKWLGGRLQRREWLATGAMTAGLAGLLASLDPTGGTQGRAGGLAWALAIGATVALVVLLVIVALRTQAARRAALLGVATGVVFGLTSALMKGMTASFHDGVTGVLTAWQTFAMVGSGLAGMYLLQNAFHAGRLVAAQPGVTLCDPAVAIVWGIVVFKETTRTGAFIGLAAASAAVMAAATVALARSPVLHDAAGSERERQSDHPPGLAAASSIGDRRSP